MPAPIKWRSKIILAKIESAYGTDPTPAGDANAILMTNVSLSPMEGEDVSRDIERPFLGAQEEFKVGLRAVLTGETELVASGSTGVAPLWGPLARACGLAEVVTPDGDPGDGTVVYNPVTDEHESVTLYIWVGGTRQVITGVRGTAVIAVGAQAIPRIRWTLTGLWAEPSEETPDAPDLSAWPRPLVATNVNTPVFTVGGVSLVMRNFEMDLGNDVQPRLLIGREEIMIVDRAEAITANVEAVPLGTFNPFARAVSLTDTAVAITQDTRDGYRLAIAIPHASVRRLEGYENQQGILEWPLRITPLPDSGDDQFTITALAAA